jgi:hypothetical protein
VDHQPGGLVDDGEVVVAMEDIECSYVMPPPLRRQGRVGEGLRD